MLRDGKGRREGAREQITHLSTCFPGTGEIATTGCHGDGEIYERVSCVSLLIGEEKVCVKVAVIQSEREGRGL